MMLRLPTYFLSHGGGPWPVVPELAEAHAPLAAFLGGLIDDVGTRPAAIIVISAHWEARIATVSSRLDHAMLYDYGGFPPQAYTLDYAAPGSPDLAARVVELAQRAGIEVALDHHRGYDHGVFVPLMVAVPGADIPLVPLSLIEGLDPAAHLALGRALAPLRDEGVLIIGSGMSMHNLRAIMNGADLGRALPFEEWLRARVTGDARERDAALLRWTTAPQARFSHPREEHLAPLFVTAGAAGIDRGRLVLDAPVFGAPSSSFRFG